jgi:hypothetical protein
MGFTFEGKNIVLKGAFFKPELIPIGAYHDLGWGENLKFKAGTLARELLMDCLGEMPKKDLVDKLQETLLTFRRENGLAWIIWADDLMKWINLPQYGIVPRMGFLSKLEDGVLTIKFPVPGVQMN